MERSDFFREASINLGNPTPNQFHELCHFSPTIYMNGKAGGCLFVVTSLESVESSTSFSI